MKFNEFLSLVLSQRFFSWLPDSLYLRIYYFLKTGKILHLKEPVSFEIWAQLYLDGNPNRIYFDSNMEIC